MTVLAGTKLDLAIDALLGVSPETPEFEFLIEQLREVLVGVVSDPPAVDAFISEVRVLLVEQRGRTLALIHVLVDQFLSSPRSGVTAELVTVPEEVLSPPPSPGPPPAVPPRPQYCVWFGTNRRPSTEGDAIVGFSSRRDQDPAAIHYGTCDVKVDKSRAFASLDSPLWKRLLRLDDDAIGLRAIQSASQSDFWRSVRHELSNWDEEARQALVYIHGYSCSFEDAARRAAQIGLDLKVGVDENTPGLMAFFSWPSRGSTKDYLPDSATIEASEASITEFLMQFVAEVGAERVHVIAHSMGNRGFLRAMRRIQDEVQRRSGVKFGQIFLAAPDVDADVFKQLARDLPLLSVRTTLYVSPGDKAVGLSKRIYDFARAGFTPPITVVKGVDTISIPDFNVDRLGHSYYAKAQGVLNDMFSLLYDNIPPARRQRLYSSVTPAGEAYWEMRK
jgi:esterase/lipase superfamily enzyme